jgi:hypothetical protein
VIVFTVLVYLLGATLLLLAAIGAGTIVDEHQRRHLR